MHAKKILFAAAALAAVAAPAKAQIVVDGNLDAAYGTPDSTVVGNNPAAGESNFGSPGPTVRGPGYTIFLQTDANNLFGFFQADGDISGARFANLYFDLNANVQSGSDLGFEITNERAFIPGQNGVYGAVPGIEFAFGANSLEFLIPLNAFTTPIAGLNYYSDGQPGSGNGTIRLNLSQTFGFSVAGGTTFGPNRLGTFQVSNTAAVPEPGTWATMLIGFGAVGSAMRRRARRTGVLAAA